MSHSTLNRCKAELKNVIASDRVKGSGDPYEAFSEGFLNFHAHYCLDDHSSSWCYHDKVTVRDRNQTLIHVDVSVCLLL